MGVSNDAAFYVEAGGGASVETFYFNNDDGGTSTVYDPNEDTYLSLQAAYEAMTYPDYKTDLPSGWSWFAPYGALLVPAGLITVHLEILADTLDAVGVSVFNSTTSWESFAINRVAGSNRWSADIVVSQVVTSKVTVSLTLPDIDPRNVNTKLVVARLG